MVARAHHRERGQTRVREREHAQPSTRAGTPDHDRAPHRPRDVQRGHRRQLVRVGGQRSGVPAADRVSRGNHVGKAGEHPWRRHRIAPEDQQAEHVHEHERVAQRLVEIHTSPPQPGEETERDHEVGVVVVVGHGQPERVMSGKPAVHAQLWIDAQRSLQVEDPLGVHERGVQAQRREVVDRVVHPCQPPDRQELNPPARARVGVCERTE